MFNSRISLVRNSSTACAAFIVVKEFTGLSIERAGPNHSPDLNLVNCVLGEKSRLLFNLEIRPQIIVVNEVSNL